MGTGEKNNPKIIMMIGLPASGKSTIAKELHSKKGYLHISSDELRKELLGSEKSQEDNVLVFDTMRARTVEALKSGQTVIYDATNISSKRRKAFLNQIPKGVKKECIYVCIDYLQCLEQDYKRLRRVGIDVISKMFENLQIPMYHEGWDVIHIHRENKKTRWRFPPNIRDLTLGLYQQFLMENPMLSDNVDLAQDNPYHTLSVHRHMYSAFKEAIKNECSESVLYACIFHDLGKCWTKENKKDSLYATFYGHENISAQLTVSTMLDLGFSKDSIIYTATLVQLHTRIIKLACSSAKPNTLNKFKDEVGDVLFCDLEKLHLADSKGR